eukprot:GHVH01000756.1.p1 GENE.GHVH01000756.1~~GHVH01000756.1.p1  ORF type:complete len:107 (-),score=10.86 GHVH01000756.1:76-396(-)
MVFDRRANDTAESTSRSSTGNNNNSNNNNNDMSYYLNSFGLDESLGSIFGDADSSTASPVVNNSAACRLRRHELAGQSANSGLLVPSDASMQQFLGVASGGRYDQF